MNIMNKYTQRNGSVVVAAFVASAALMAMVMGISGADFGKFESGDSVHTHALHGELRRDYGLTWQELRHVDAPETAMNTVASR